jgi:hypothetical protein
MMTATYQKKGITMASESPKMVNIVAKNRTAIEDRVSSWLYSSGIVDKI